MSGLSNEPAVSDAVRNRLTHLGVTVQQALDMGMLADVQRTVAEEQAKAGSQDSKAQPESQWTREQIEVSLLQLTPEMQHTLVTFSTANPDLAQAEKAWATFQKGDQGPWDAYFQQHAPALLEFAVDNQKWYRTLLRRGGVDNTLYKLPRGLYLMENAGAGDCMYLALGQALRWLNHQSPADTTCEDFRGIAAGGLLPLLRRWRESDEADFQRDPRLRQGYLPPWPRFKQYISGSIPGGAKILADLTHRAQQAASSATAIQQADQATEAARQENSNLRGHRNVWSVEQSQQFKASYLRKYEQKVERQIFEAYIQQSQLIWGDNLFLELFLANPNNPYVPPHTRLCILLFDRLRPFTGTSDARASCYAQTYTQGDTCRWIILTRTKGMGGAGGEHYELALIMDPEKTPVYTTAQLMSDGAVWELQGPQGPRHYPGYLKLTGGQGAPSIFEVMVNTKNSQECLSFLQECLAFDRNIIPLS